MSHNQLIQDLETALHYLDCALSNDWNTSEGESEDDAARFYDEAMTRMPAQEVKP